MPGAQCTRSLACEVKKHTSVVHHRYAGPARHSLRNGFNGFLRALLGDRACCHRRLADTYPPSLTPSVGASGPHDFAVRISTARLASLPRPPHPAPNVRDDRANAPLEGARDRRNLPVIWGRDQGRPPAADWHDGQISALGV